MNVGVFVDTINLHKNIKNKFFSKLDYELYMGKVKYEGDIYRAIAYGSQVSDEAHKFITYLRRSGFLPKYFEPKKDIINVRDILSMVKRMFRLEYDDNIFSYLKAKYGNLKQPFTDICIHNTDISTHMMLDIIKLADRLDVVIIGSSNPNIIPIINYLDSKGIRTIVFSCNIPYSIKSNVVIWWEISNDFLEREIDDEDLDEEDLDEEEVLEERK